MGAETREELSVEETKRFSKLEQQRQLSRASGLAILAAERAVRAPTRVDYFLRDERRAMQLFMQDLARGAFTYAPPTLGQLSRAIEVDRRFANLSFGLVDGSIVALAESLGIRRLATREKCVISPPFAFGTAARSIWWHIQRIPTSPDSTQRWQHSMHLDGARQ